MIVNEKMFARGIEMSSGLVKATNETPMPGDVIGKSTGNHASITGSA